jgi:hypothetical protein
MRWSVLVAIAALGCGGKTLDDSGRGDLITSGGSSGGGGEGGSAGAGQGGTGGTSLFLDAGVGPGGAAGAGTGGAGGGFADGGGGISCPASYPLPPLSDFTPRTLSPNLSVEEELVRAHDALAGYWVGVVTTEWMPAYPIKALIGSDGHYSAVCTENSQCCVAFYWGTDQDSELKQIRLDAMGADGKFQGQIDMVWCYPEQGCYVGWAGDITDFEYDQTGRRVRFQLHNERACCPVYVELERR